MADLDLGPLPKEQENDLNGQLVDLEKPGFGSVNADVSGDHGIKSLLRDNDDLSAKVGRLELEVTKWKDFSLVVAENHDKLKTQSESDRAKDRRIIDALKD